jgi:hypothetical protein
MSAVGDAVAAASAVQPPPEQSWTLGNVRRRRRRRPRILDAIQVAAVVPDVDVPTREKRTRMDGRGRNRARPEERAGGDVDLVENAGEVGVVDRVRGVVDPRGRPRHRVRITHRLRRPSRANAAGRRGKAKELPGKVHRENARAVGRDGDRRAVEPPRRGLPADGGGRGVDAREHEEVGAAALGAEVDGVGGARVRVGVEHDPGGGVDGACRREVPVE